MPDKKLTDAEIIKGLEDTLHRIKGAEHLIVPKLGVENLCNGLENALDLINRLQAENEELVGNIDKLKAELFDKTEQLKIAKAENERLESLSERLGDNVNWKANYIYELEDNLETAKAEAYKECIEKVKEKSNRMELVCSGTPVRTDYTITEEKLDNLLKELVGEDK